MKSLYDFIIKPVGDLYKNEIQVGDKKLVLNTKIESWKFVNRLAEVVEVPIAFKTKINKGDKIIVHQNVFRVFYNIRGEKKKSRSFFKDDLYFCNIDQIYLYKNSNRWHSFGDRCFIQPIKETSSTTLDKEQKKKFIVKYCSILKNRSDKQFVCNLCLKYISRDRIPKRSRKTRRSY